MPNRNAVRRLEALEHDHARIQFAGDGYAGEAWARLAPWAMAVHAAGGWDAAIALVNAGQPLPGYTALQGGVAWDIALFWQRGDTRRFPTREQEQQVLWIIAACVGQVLDAGTPRAEIERWDLAGREV